MEQFFFTYGGAFIAAFFVTLFLLANILFFERRVKWERVSPHHTPTVVSRLGGVALIGGFLLVLFHSAIPLFPLSWWVFGGVLGIVLIVGVWDDFRNIPWTYQLALQFAVLTALFAGGVHIMNLTVPGGMSVQFTTGWLLPLGFLIFILWGGLIINAVNWLDGVDGLCASIMTITYSTLFLLALSPHVYQPAIAILLAAALGGTIAFLVYNYPPARIIGGTSGSLFFGIVVVFVSIVAGTKIATTLLVLALPISDTFFVLLKRAIEGRSLVTADRGHLHHILQNRGWSDRKIVFMYSVLTVAIALVALSTQNLGKFTASIIVFGLLVLIFTFFHFHNRVSKKWFWWGSIAMLALTVIATSYSLSSRQIKNTVIDGHWYQVEVVDTPEKRAEGLSNRESICMHCGMLFVFPEPVEVSFWMKDMKFSIDIVWLAGNTVVAKNENLPYPSLELFDPEIPITKVLELPAGGAKHISVGEKIYFW